MNKRPLRCVGRSYKGTLFFLDRKGLNWWIRNCPNGRHASLVFMEWGLL